jgi:hypothetical protein
MSAAIELSDDERALLIESLAALLTVRTRCRPTDEETAQTIIALAKKIGSRPRGYEGERLMQ